jgi:hypothetical protein
VGVAGDGLRRALQLSSAQVELHFRGEKPLKLYYREAGKSYGRYPQITPITQSQNQKTNRISSPARQPILGPQLLYVLFLICEICVICGYLFINFRRKFGGACGIHALQNLVLFEGPVAIAHVKICDGKIVVR